MTIPLLTTPNPTTPVTPTTARVVEVTAYGGPDVLRMRSIPRPEATAGRVRVAVAASTVNLVDILGRSGAFASLLPDLEPPFVVGQARRNRRCGARRGQPRLRPAARGA